MTADFVEARRAALAVFCGRVVSREGEGRGLAGAGRARAATRPPYPPQASHPMLAPSPHLAAFLTASEDDWSLHMADANARAAAAGAPLAAPPSPARVPASPAAAAKKTLGAALERLKGLGATAAAFAAGRVGGDDAAAATLAAGDPEFLAAREYVTTLEAHLTDLHKAAARLVRKQADAGVALADFGAAATALSRSDGSPLAAAFAGLAESADMLARVSALQAERLAACFDAPLKEAARAARAARDAVADRLTAAATLTAARAAVDAKRAKLSRLRATPGAPEAAVRDAEAALVAAQRAVDTARADADATASRCAADLPRYQAERAAAVSAVLADFAAAQGAAAADGARVWRSYAPKAAAAADGE